MRDGERVERTHAFLEHPDTLDLITSTIANGGSLTELCRARDIRYSDVILWLYDRRQPERKKVYEQALDARSEWAVQRVLDEVRLIGTLDVRRAFDSNENLLPLKAMPEEVARAIVSFEVISGPHNSTTTKVKFASKLKALELLGKQVHMFVQRVELSGDKSLADLVEESFEPEKVEEVKPPSRGDLVSEN